MDTLADSQNSSHLGLRFGNARLAAPVFQHFETPFLRWLDKPPRHTCQLDTMYLHDELILRIADSV